MAVHGTVPSSFFHFQFLEPPGVVARKRGLSRGFVVSLIAHGVLFAAAALVPLFAPEVLPDPGVGLRAFFAPPPEIAPAPPPPPPPAPMVRRAAVPTAPVPREIEAPRFVAPVEVPDVVAPERDTLGLMGIEGGVPGGVEGGVPGGVVGGVVGGLPSAPP